jgi:hypothetical protein
MLCKVPAIATVFGLSELIDQDCGWLVKVKELVWGLFGILDIQGALVDIDDFVAKLTDA